MEHSLRQIDPGRIEGEEKGREGVGWWWCDPERKPEKDHDKNLRRRGRDQDGDARWD